MPHRKRYLFVCTNRREDGNPKGSCAQKGADVLLKRLKEELVTLGVHKEVRACSSSCLDLCESGISIVEEPHHVAYGKVSLEDIPELARAFAEGRVVERLVVHGSLPGTASGHDASTKGLGEDETP